MAGVPPINLGSGFSAAPFQTNGLQQLGQALGHAPELIGNETLAREDTGNKLLAPYRQAVAANPQLAYDEGFNKRVNSIAKAYQIPQTWQQKGQDKEQNGLMDPMLFLGTPKKLPGDLSPEQTQQLMSAQGPEQKRAMASMLGMDPDSLPAEVLNAPPMYSLAEKSAAMGKLFSDVTNTLRSGGSPSTALGMVNAAVSQGIITQAFADSMTNTPDFVADAKQSFMTKLDSMRQTGRMNAARVDQLEASARNFTSLDQFRQVQAQLDQAKIAEIPSQIAARATQAQAAMINAQAHAQDAHTKYLQSQNATPAEQTKSWAESVKSMKGLLDTANATVKQWQIAESAADKSSIGGADYGAIYPMGGGPTTDPSTGQTKPATGKSLAELLLAAQAAQTQAQAAYTSLIASNPSNKAVQNALNKNGIKTTNDTTKPPFAVPAGFTAKFVDGTWYVLDGNGHWFKKQ